MNRQEIYKKIEALGLQDEVKRICGRNFTTVSSVQLEKIIDDKETEKNMQEAKQSAAKKAFQTIVEAAEEDKLKKENCCSDKLDRLLNILGKRHLLCRKDIKFISGELF